MAVSPLRSLTHLLFVFPFLCSSDENSYLVKITTDGSKVTDVTDVVADDCSATCSAASLKNWKIAPDCINRSKAKCEQSGDEDYCWWDNPKQRCRVTLRDTDDFSITASLSKYSNGYSLEVAGEDHYVCGNMVNAPTATLWGIATQGILYFLCLMYSFLGVAIVADIFMSAIETITAKQREVVVTNEEGKKFTVQVRVWNETVANLTLLALGSSAPEILLATLETVTSLGEPAGELGPSTIVGSAAFNLFMITAVCMVSVPAADGKSESGIRKISELGVFLITATSSVWAYLWMFLCIVVISRGTIDLWEAIVTFMMFPALVIFAWLQDTHKLAAFCSSGGKTNGELLEGGERGMEKFTVESIMKRDTNVMAAKDLMGVGETPDDKTIQAITNRAIAKNQPAQKRSYMVYRVNAIRGLTGKKSVVPQKTTDDYEAELAELDKKKTDMNQGPKAAEVETLIEFNTQEYAVREDAGSITIAVTRTGNLDSEHLVSYNTVDGTAIAPDDYTAAEATIKFGKGERVKTFSIDIMEDEEVELDEFFYVVMANPMGPSVRLGEHKICTIKILDVSSPGKVGFKYEFKRCQESCEKVKVSVQRKEGAMGEFFVDWKTQDGTAIAGIDYEAANGSLKFDAGEMYKELFIKVIDNEEHDARDRSFEVVLYNPRNENNSAQLIESKKVCRLDISDDENYSQVVNKIMGIWNKQMKQFSLTTGSWKEQFEEACDCPEDPTAMDFFLHALSFPWKMLFAFLPPTGYANGWVTFFTSLALIGIVTFFIGEFAATFGCMMNINKPVVAITIVALGTSMPDTFASRTATMMAPDADAAIGNVTGSNSVNVFLGMGLPWLIATIYSGSKGEDYEQPEGTIAFAVMVFTPCALICLGTLLLRRKIVGGELGGSPMGRWITFAFYTFLWILFIVLSVLKDGGTIE